MKEKSDHFVLIYKDGLKQFTEKEVLCVFHTIFPLEKNEKPDGILERGRYVFRCLEGDFHSPDSYGTRPPRDNMKRECWKIRCNELKAATHRRYKIK